MSYESGQVKRCSLISDPHNTVFFYTLPASTGSFANLFFFLFPPSLQSMPASIQTFLFFPSSSFSLFVFVGGGVVLAFLFFVLFFVCCFQFEQHFRIEITQDLSNVLSA